MFAVQSQFLEPMLRKFDRRALLDDADRRAFLSLPIRQQSLEANVCIVREGDRPDRSCILVSGFVVRHKVTESGERQIVSVHIAGDFLDLEGALFNVADHNIQTLTRCEVAFVPRSAVRELIVSHPQLGMAMWVDTLIDSSIFREWIVNVGRRDGRARVAHLLCEFARRQEAAEMITEDGYQLPMTQEQIADATGMTPVHVNRVLKTLSLEGLISRTKCAITIPDWEGLRSVAGFYDTYLHLDQGARGLRENRSVG